MASSRSSSYVLVREVYPRARTKPGTVSQVQEILAGPGAVHRIYLEENQPTRVWRWREVDDMEEEGVDLDGALRNVEDMLEYTNPDESATPFETVVHMMLLLSREGAHPVCWAVGPSTQHLRGWLRLEESGMGGEIDSLLCVDVLTVKALPDETLVLAGSRASDGEIADIVVAVKATMDVRGESAGHEVVDASAGGGGDHPAGDSEPTGEVEGGAGRNGGGVWKPSDFLRAQLGRG